MEARRMGTRVLDSRTGGPGRGVALVCVLSLSCGNSGCAAGPGAEDVAASPVAPVSQEARPVVGNVPTPMLEAALQDAERRTSLAREDIEVIVAEPVTWPDGSLGCPQPGMMYTQALVPGYRVVLRAGGEELNYHAGRGGTPSFCPAEHVTPPSGAGEDRI
jgi:hypothetical protein